MPGKGEGGTTAKSSRRGLNREKKDMRDDKSKNLTEKK